VARVDKLTAARRQFATAVDLWFADGDPVSTHTLVAASGRVFSDLLRHKGLTDHLVNNAYIRPDKRREWIAAIRRPSNFFKHADDDPGDVHEFDESINALHMLHSIVALEQLGCTLTALELAFLNRFELEHPDVLVDGAVRRAITTSEFELLRNCSRAEFLDSFLKARGLR
jgi:hypothetical protein